MTDIPDIRRLADYLRQQGLDTGGLSVRSIDQSASTFRIDAASGSLVLRKVPPGTLLPAGHGLDREFRVLTALADNGVPVPRIYGYCEDDSVAGTPFLLLEHIAGRHFSDPSLPGLSRQERREIYADINRVLAALHDIDHHAARLETCGEAGSQFAQQISSRAQQYRDCAPVSLPAMEALIDWLSANVPDGDRTCVVHGDFRMDNLILHPEEPRVLAVLDWQRTTLGHPQIDLCHFCLYWRLPPSMWRGVAGKDILSLGIPTEPAFIEDYCRARRISEIRHLDFYLAYSLFRVAVSLQSDAACGTGANATSQQSTEIGAKVEALAELGLRYVRRSAT